MKKNNGLGKGLSSLIPNKSGSASAQSLSRSTSRSGEEHSSKEVQGSSVVGQAPLVVDITCIDPNNYQPRKYFDNDELDALAASIKEHGILQPPVVTELPNGRYELIAGERRLQASKLAGLQEIPVIVRPSMKNQVRLELALIENVQRHDLNVIEEARAYQLLMDEFSLTQEEVAKRIGKSRSVVANAMRLLDLPVEIQKALISGTITEGHARVLRSLKERSKQLALFQEIVKFSLSVRQAEQRLAGIQKKTSVVKSHERSKASVDPDIRALEQRLQEHLQTNVDISLSSDGGKLVLRFSDKSDLNTLLDRMSQF